MMKKTGKGDGSLTGPVRDLKKELEKDEKQDKAKSKDLESK
ncbi:hypothetical protein N8Z24_00335 [bacterium]|nr:hypothetical protein [bacterium]